MIPDPAVQEQVIGLLRPYNWENGPLPTQEIIIEAIYNLTTPGGGPSAGVKAPKAFLELYSPEANNYGVDDFTDFRRSVELVTQEAVTFTSLNVDGGQLKVIRELCNARSLPCYIFYKNGHEVDRLEIQNRKVDTVLNQLIKHFIVEESEDDDEEESEDDDEEEPEDDDEEEPEDDDEEESENDKK